MKILITNLLTLKIEVFAKFNPIINAILTLASLILFCVGRLFALLEEPKSPDPVKSRIITRKMKNNFETELAKYPLT